MVEKKPKWPQDYINIKCIIFTFYIALSYWLVFKPTSPKKMYSIFAIINYIGMNWYNYAYHCSFNHFGMTATLCSLLSLIFYYIPKRNKIVMAFLLYLPYFLLAWYDFFMNCRFRMQPTILPFGRYIYLPIKPNPYKKRYAALDPVIKQNIINFDKYVAVSLVLGGVIFLMFRLLRE